MDPSDMTLSEVHVDRPYEKSDEDWRLKDYTVVCTRFHFQWPSTEEVVSACPADLDEDGDFILERKLPSGHNEVITLEHTISSRVEDVGLQVWNGCLLLADYLLHMRTSLEGHVVLELGGGTGLASIVAATHARSVICTDVGADVLTLCSRNIRSNRALFPRCPVLVQELNWFDDAAKGVSLPGTDGDNELSGSEEARRLLLSADIIIAADVIYEDDLTDAFFRIVHRFMSSTTPKTLFLTLERRVNFTLTERGVASPAYDHFLECARQLRTLTPAPEMTYDVERLDNDFRQSFTYDRSKYLELWRITCSPNKSS